jgi:hypothetical protein
VNTYSFDERRVFSALARGRAWEDVIKDTLPGCVSVVATDLETDKSGTDYVATLRRGSIINIDLKMRSKAGMYWTDGAEEIALEVWSVMPHCGARGKVGWTLDESKTTHYTLHVFDPVDSDRIFLLPFQLLRKAFRANCKIWCDRYRTAIQSSGAWRSQCVFVPADVVMAAIGDAMICSTITLDTDPPPC